MAAVNHANKKKWKGQDHMVMRKVTVSGFMLYG